MTGANAKIKRIYVGTTKVRPAVEIFSYNFIGKTTTDLTNDGWVTKLGTPSISSYGLVGNNLSIWKTFDISLANAKKIVQNFNGRHGRSGTADLVFGLEKVSGNTESNKTQVYNSYSSYNNCEYGGTVSNFTHTLGTAGAMAYTYTLDLENKTVTLKYTTGSTSTFTYTLTDSQITNIRTNNNIVIYLNGSNEAISDFSIEVY